jgi:tungstate transport system permease protein
MDSFTESARVALGLVAGGDPRLWAVVALSLQVSALACLLAGAFGLAAGAWLAVAQFPGRRIVVGLVKYLLLSRSGPLGSLGLLFSPTAMVLAQAVLVLPVLTALTRQAIEGPWRDHGDQIRSLGAPRWLGGCLLLWDERLAILTVLLTAFGRAVSEVGAVMVVGGNIDGFTRVMTTTIALETSKGDLPLALGLGLVLLGVVLALNAAGAGLGLLARQRRGAGHA